MKFFGIGGDFWNVGNLYIVPISCIFLLDKYKYRNPSHNELIEIYQGLYYNIGNAPSPNMAQVCSDIANDFLFILSRIGRVLGEK